MTEYLKYPHTPYLACSPTIEGIDEQHKSTKLIFNNNNFRGKSFVATIKMDGENTTMYPDHIHARSLDSRHHESRSYVKQLHSRIKHDIPKGWRICGENMYAVHSIKYDSLEDYFLVFSIWDSDNECLTWKDTVQYSRELGLKTVPTIMPISNIAYDKRSYFIITDPDNILVDTNVLANQEGFVIRNVDSFRYSNFSKNMAKWVRVNHIQTDQHWMAKKVEKNLLRKD
jgi:hypothetical protein